MIYLVKGLLVVLVLALLLWIRMGRPGTDRLPPRLRAWARWLPFLAGPALLVLTVWGWTSPWGSRSTLKQDRGR